MWETHGETEQKSDDSLFSYHHGFFLGRIDAAATRS
jgi:hypothetical protein